MMWFREWRIKRLQKVLYDQMVDSRLPPNDPQDRVRYNELHALMLGWANSLEPKPNLEELIKYLYHEMGSIVEAYEVIYGRKPDFAWLSVIDENVVLKDQDKEDLR